MGCFFRNGSWLSAGANNKLASLVAPASYSAVELLICAHPHVFRLLLSLKVRAGTTVSLVTCLWMLPGLRGGCEPVW